MRTVVREVVFFVFVMTLTLLTLIACETWLRPVLNGLLT